ncbi:MAG: EscU/YscU/HrcU family type III secretion system export apparatus switch protein [Bdellovibrionales bacterium]|nr:EscU/YscU/HrcU family type III secretion system export apparatus switch protein [Bdellovibrionales bacterium]
MASEKPHEPSPKRLRQARKDGEVVKSPILSSSCSLFCVALTFLTLIPLFWRKNEILLQWLLTHGFTDPELAVRKMTTPLLIFLVVPLLVAALGGVLVEGLQVGFSVEFSSIRMKLSRLNPAQGVMRSLSGVKKSWIEGLKLLVLGVLTLWLPLWFLSFLPEVFYAPSSVTVGLFRSNVLRFLCFQIVALLLLGIFEYGVNRKEFMKRHSMSHDEVRREYKEDEGDPQMKALRKSLHEQALMADLTERIRHSKVIIVRKQTAS